MPKTGSRPPFAGYIQVYTGHGKGKTTAALGLALRALGWGLKVMMVQFIKGYKNVGEIRFSELYPESFTVRQFALDLERDIDEKKVLSRKREADEAMKFAEEAVRSGAYDLVILDELNVAVHYGLIGVERVIRLVQDKPAHVELVITGRNAPDELVQASDYATEMRLVRHPFQKGVEARPGVDY